MLRDFDEVFPDVAARAVRQMETVDDEWRLTRHLLLESYCCEPRCDCWRAVIDVTSLAGGEVVATVFIDLRTARPKNVPLVEMDPQGPRGTRAREVVAVLRETVAADPAYIDMLRVHYAMMKQAGAQRSGRRRSPKTATSEANATRAAVERDGGRAAVTGKGARASSETVADRKGKRAAGAPTGVGSSHGGSAGVALVAAKVARVEGKVQRRFRTLLEKVDRLKQRVRVWTERRGDIGGEMARYAAAHERQQGALRELAVLLDGMAAQTKMAKAERRKLAALICALTSEVIEAGGHDDLKAIYNRHGGGDFDAEAAADDAVRTEAMRSMMEMYGIELGDADVSTPEKLKAFAEEQMREAAAKAEAEEEARRARRKKSAKQAAAEEQRADERRRTEKVLQEVYRALAMAMHPDREQDPAERVRKTELMREVNIAYEAKDLLRLLELQLELEKLRPEQVETVAEERLKHFNRLLDEQARQLAEELAGIELPFRLQMGEAARSMMTPEQVIARIRADMRVVEQRTRDLARDLETFRDPALLKAFLKRRRESEWEREVEEDLFDRYG